jgi:chemotaxis protein MotB
MARRKYDEQHENHERWLVSYADLITLLFAFFVVMYAISSVNEGKYKVFSASLGSAFGGPGAQVNGADPQSLLDVPNPLLRRQNETLLRERSQMKLLAQDLLRTLAPLVREGKVRVTQTSRGVSVDINASVLFDPGEAVLTDESRTALVSIAQVLKNDAHAIQVEGHTDNTPINTAMFPSNWELSAVRASAVVRLFAEVGVPGARLTAVGVAANEPVATNQSPEGRARNRRVTVTILSGLPDVATEVQP